MACPSTCPRWSPTFGKRLTDYDSNERQSRAQDLASRHLQNIPTRRPGTKEEQAAAITFLASDDASIITGQILSVGGGAVVP